MNPSIPDVKKNEVASSVSAQTSSAGDPGAAGERVVSHTRSNAPATTVCLSGSAEFSLEELAEAGDEGENGWNAYRRAGSPARCSASPPASTITPMTRY